MGRVHWVSKRAPVVLRLNRYCFGFFVGDAEGVGNNRAKAERLRGCKRHFKSPSFPVVFLGFLLHLHVNPRRNYGFRRVDVACLNNEVVGTWARRIFFFLAFQRQGRYLGCDFVILRVLALFLAGVSSPASLPPSTSSTALRKRSFRIMQPGIALTLSTTKSDVYLSSM